ncbi:MAG: ImmA/IrrE family metallo-endopeptidase, partial [Deltaproteobacteria bacterium]|nr:ImmA/IrrE family metallo-endopeptidase [Deltaproteobacteria bacterium]
QTGDRRRFTLAHELGHLVMHRFPTTDMETEANTFASSLLMPRANIRKYFEGKKVDLRLLAGLKPEWRVSMQGLLHRAQDLGVVSYNQARYLWSQFNAQKIKMREPPELDITPEEPTMMPKLLRLHLDELGYSLLDLAEMVKMFEDELIDFQRISTITTESGRPRLRVI